MPETLTFTNWQYAYIENQPNDYTEEFITGTAISEMWGYNKSGWHRIPNQKPLDVVTPVQFAKIMNNCKRYRLKEQTVS